MLQEKSFCQPATYALQIPHNYGRSRHLSYHCNLYGLDTMKWDLTFWGERIEFSFKVPRRNKQYILPKYYYRPTGLSLIVSPKIILRILLVLKLEFLYTYQVNHSLDLRKGLSPSVILRPN